MGWVPGGVEVVGADGLCPLCRQFYQACKTGIMDRALSIYFLLGWLGGDLLNLIGSFLANQLPLQVPSSLPFPQGCDLGEAFPWDHQLTPLPTGLHGRVLRAGRPGHAVSVLLLQS